MEEILEEIRELKAQQRVMNNLVIENGKRNEIVLDVLKELLLEPNGAKENDKVIDALNKVLKKLNEIVKFLSD